MSYCPGCGAEVGDSSAFCKACGTRIAGGQVTTSVPAKKKGNALAIVLALLLVLCLGGAGYLGYQYLGVNKNLEDVQAKYPPHYFASEAALKAWVDAKIPQLGSSMTTRQKHFQLQTWALADGYVWSVALRLDQGTVQSQVMVAGTVYYVKITGEVGVLVD